MSVMAQKKGYSGFERLEACGLAMDLIFVRILSFHGVLFCHMCSTNRGSAQA